jgi:hypothetical protein
MVSLGLEDRLAFALPPKYECKFLDVFFVVCVAILGKDDFH